MHRNAHIWIASHPLLVTYYCWVTVYSPKKKVNNIWRPPGIERTTHWLSERASVHCAIRETEPDGYCFSTVKCRLFKLQITTCDENGKIQLSPKITNHLFTCYLNCTCKSNPVCLISTMVGHLFVGFLFAMTLLSSLGIRKSTHWLFPICVHSERVCS